MIRKLFVVLLLVLLMPGCTIGNPQPNSWDVQPWGQTDPGPVPINIDSQPARQRREVLAFTASWCGPCQRDAPRRQALIRDGVVLREIDVDRYQELAKSWQIQAVPTYIVLADGREVKRTNSIGDVEAWKDWLLNRQ
jgi:thioredoxin 1